VHFFPFGALVPTAAWATDIRDGRFEVDDQYRLRVPA
jgi:methylenetetrahydrofolate reductase (NADPH)